MRENFDLSRGAPGPDTVNIDLITNPGGVPVQELWEANPNAFLYKGGSTENGSNFIGHPALRQTLAGKHGLDNDRRIITAAGGMDSMSLVLSYLSSQTEKSQDRTFTKVLTEIPTYDRFPKNLKNHNIVSDGVPITEDGLNLEILEQKLKAGDIDMFYGIPEGQNPTGYNYTAEERAQVENLCAQHGVLVLWDGAYWNLTYGGRLNEPIKNPAENVIWSFNFTKEISAGFKNGYLVIPEKIAGDFEQVVSNERLNPNYLNELVLDAILNDPRYAEHLAMLRSKFGARAQTLSEELKKMTGRVSGINLSPDSGYFIQPRFELGNGQNHQAFLERLKKAGVTAGNAADTFASDASDPVMNGEVRIPFSAMTSGQITEVISRIAQAAEGR